MTVAKTVELCAGCVDDFYNKPEVNGLGVKRCWHFDDAKVEERVEVGKWDEPPYIWRSKTILSCRHVSGRAYLRRNDVRVVADAAAAKVWK